MRKIISAAAMREIDRLTAEQYKMPSLLLMESAATASAQAIAARVDGDLSQKNVLVLCGRGNNGGDGAALARILSLMGAWVETVLFGSVEETKGDARINFEATKSLADEGSAFANPFGTSYDPEMASLILFHNSSGSLSFVECNTFQEWEQFLYSNANQPFDIIVDALFGTGLTRPLDELPREAVNFIERMRGLRNSHQGDVPLIVSLDVPSGLDADSADVSGATIQADLTVTFTAPKLANVLPPASYRNGELVIANIGSPAKLIEEAASELFLVEREDARRWLVQTRYAPGSYKNTHGHALVIAGSRDYTGAPVLCGDAAMQSGAGLVTVATAASAHDAVSARLMSEVISASLPETEDGAISFEAIERADELIERANVVAVGPGLSSKSDSTRRFVRHIVSNRKTPVVIDADALNALAPWPEDLSGSDDFPLILTPHAGEMRRLIGAADDAAITDRVQVARDFASAHDLILVLKGARTIIAAPDTRVFVVPTGNAGLGTAGSGDTLTGIITGFIAQAYGTLKKEASALDAVIAAVYIGGLAGDIAAREKGMRTLVASDIRGHLTAAIRQLDLAGEMP